jgi:hypothetical protein
MLSSLRTIWLRIRASRYTRALEDENARLRAENRALLNSILGIAGIPPLRVDAEIERQRGRDVRAGSRTGKGGTSYDAPHNFHPRVDDKHKAGPQRETAEGDVRHSDGGADETRRSARAKGLIVPANPLRRRSWQQIGRILEIENARRMNNRDNSDSML